MGVADWVLSLEVAEHIPPSFEEMFLRNVVAHASKGVVISWAIPGQGGTGHVNVRSHEYVEQRFAKLGWVHDDRASSHLRAVAVSVPASGFHYFNNTMHVFRRAS